MKKHEDEALKNFLKPLRKDEIMNWAMEKSPTLYRLLSPLTKSEILKMATVTCRHHSHFDDHPNCFFDPKIGRAERIGILDIETLSLRFRADMGVILCYCILDFNSGKVKSRSLSKQELFARKNKDKQLVKELIEDIKKYDRIVGHNVTGFDLPFIRSKAVHYRLRFPHYRSLFVTDTLKIMWKRFRLKSASLGNSCKYFGIPAKETPFEFGLWIEAVQGNRKAMKKVVDHCREDVEANARLFQRILYYVPLSRMSV